MKKTLLAFAICCVLPTAAWCYDGPLQVRNQFPLYIGMAPPFFESAQVRDTVSVQLSYSSMFLVEESPEWSVGMDLELTELELRLKKRIGDRTELGLEVPFLRTSKGFFDRPLVWLHDTLHTGDYNRHTRPVNEFLYDVRYLGQPVLLPRGGQSGIGDVRLTGKRVLHEGSTLVSLAADVEFPTGSVEDGFGNGSVDAGAALLAEVDLGEKYHGYGNVGVVLPGDLQAYQTIGQHAYAWGGAGIEAAWWEHFHVIVQVVVQGSPFPHTGIRKLDWPGVMLTMGGRYHFEKSSIEFSLTEDPDTAATPDFIANIGYALKY